MTSDGNAFPSGARVWSPASVPPPSPAARWRSRCCGTRGRGPGRAVRRVDPLGAARRDEDEPLAPAGRLVEHVDERLQLDPRPVAEGGVVPGVGRGSGSFLAWSQVMNERWSRGVLQGGCSSAPSGRGWGGTRRRDRVRGDREQCLGSRVRSAPGSEPLQQAVADAPGVVQGFLDAARPGEGVGHAPGDGVVPVGPVAVG